MYYSALLQYRSNFRWGYWLLFYVSDLVMSVVTVLYKRMRMGL